MPDGTRIVLPRPLMPHLLHRASDEGQSRAHFIGVFENAEAVPDDPNYPAVYCWAWATCEQATLGFNAARLRTWAREEAVAISIPADPATIDGAVEHFQGISRMAFRTGLMTLRRRFPNDPVRMLLPVGFPRWSRA